MRKITQLFFALTLCIGLFASQETLAQQYRVQVRLGDLDCGSSTQAPTQINGNITIGTDVEYFNAYTSSGTIIYDEQYSSLPTTMDTQNYFYYLPGNSYCSNYIPGVQNRSLLPSQFNMGQWVPYVLNGTVGNKLYLEIRFTQFLSGSISGNQTICYNTDPGNISNAAYASGGNGPISYSWEWSPTVRIVGQTFLA